MKSDRVQAFSDGIFAILITILVLEFRLPRYTAGALAAAVLAQWPILFAYVLTFSYIGILWLFHHVDAGSPLYEELRAGAFAENTLGQNIQEELELLRRLELDGTAFFGLHTSNVIPVAGTLPEDKDRLIEMLEKGMGDGFFGGCVISYQQMGEQAGETVKKILDGTPPDKIAVKNVAARYEFDYNQLLRFGIAESSLPKGSVILNRPVTFWSENRQTLIPGIIIISILLLMLLMSVCSGKKRAALQQKLADSQKLYRTAANSADLVVWEYDPSSRVITMTVQSQAMRVSRPSRSAQQTSLGVIAVTFCPVRRRTPRASKSAVM